MYVGMIIHRRVDTASHRVVKPGFRPPVPLYDMELSCLWFKKCRLYYKRENMNCKYDKGGYITTVVLYPTNPTLHPLDISSLKTRESRWKGLNRSLTLGQDGEA